MVKYSRRVATSLLNLNKGIIMIKIASMASDPFGNNGDKTITAQFNNWNTK